MVYLYKFLEIWEKNTMGVGGEIDLIWTVWACESVKQACAIWNGWMHDWMSQYRQKLHPL